MVRKLIFFTMSLTLTTSCLDKAPCITPQTKLLANYTDSSGNHQEIVEVGANWGIHSKSESTTTAWGSVVRAASKDKHGFKPASITTLAASAMDQRALFSTPTAEMKLGQPSSKRFSTAFRVARRRKSNRNVKDSLSS